MQFIQELPNNPVFVIILIIATGYVWFNARKWIGIDEKGSWWNRHIADDFPEEYHPECFNCNEGPEVCPNCEYRRW